MKVFARRGNEHLCDPAVQILSKQVVIAVPIRLENHCAAVRCPCMRKTRARIEAQPTHIANCRTQGEVIADMHRRLSRASHDRNGPAITGRAHVGQHVYGQRQPNRRSQWNRRSGIRLHAPKTAAFMRLPIEI